MAFRKVSAAQENERPAAKYSANNAHDRIAFNILIFMGITLALIFSLRRLIRQKRKKHPTISVPVHESVGLLTPFSFGVTDLFSSALHLSTMHISHDLVLKGTEDQRRGSRPLRKGGGKIKIKPLYFFSQKEQSRYPALATSISLQRAEVSVISSRSCYLGLHMLASTKKRSSAKVRKNSD
jgi:hypothetical protein